jgi:mannose-1-phosphate guanylyltransferase/mannose-1-phosphate guanylyltransferase/mannose-6-phosphate isomerase
LSDIQTALDPYHDDACHPCREFQSAALACATFGCAATDQVAHAGIMRARIMVMPEGRTSGAAILAAARLHARTPDAVLLVCPSDMDVTDSAAFETAVAQGAAAAMRGAFVTFGVKPTYAETGYGYLELQRVPKPGDFSAVSLRTFVQKPDRARAEAMVAGTFGMGASSCSGFQAFLRPSRLMSRA